MSSRKQVHGDLAGLCQGAGLPGAAGSLDGGVKYSAVTAMMVAALICMVLASAMGSRCTMSASDLSDRCLVQRYCERGDGSGRLEFTDVAFDAAGDEVPGHRQVHRGGPSAPSYAGSAMRLELGRLDVGDQTPTRTRYAADPEELKPNAVWSGRSMR